MFLVDRLLKWREDRKWKVAKNFAYTKVVLVTGNLIYAILPHEYMKICGHIFYFGDLSGSPLFITNEKYDQESTELSEKIMYKVFRHKKDVLDILRKYIDKIDELLSKYSNMLELEIVSRLFTIKERIERTVFVSSYTDDGTDSLVTISEVKQLSKDLLSFVGMIEQLQVFLLEKADRIVQVEEIIDEILDLENADSDLELLQRLETKKEV